MEATISNRISVFPAPKFYVFSAGVIFLITGCAKIWSSFGHAGLLYTNDPIIGIEYRYLLFLTALAELAIAFVCFFSKKSLFPSVLSGWFATTVLLYRIGLSLVGWTKPCSCLGNLTDALHISPILVDNLMKYVIAYLLCGSAFSIWATRSVDKFGIGKKC